MALYTEYILKNVVLCVAVLVAVIWVVLVLGYVMRLYVCIELVFKASVCGICYVIVVLC